MLGAFSLTILAAQTGCAHRSPPPSGAVIAVTGGKVQGVEVGGVKSFKGLPYAAPPVGENRWRAPQPVVAWSGIRSASQYSEKCIQHGLIGTSGKEDCLYLNVFAPKGAGQEPLPVMVWIHGGSFAGGSGADTDGAQLALRGVVVVTINYRLGVFGFLAHPELSAESSHGSGEDGILDQIAALQWVHDNIAAFGGDPANVTIFGCSAGGESVAILAASPLAKGLFQRAISESGFSFQPIHRKGDEIAAMVPPMADAERIGVAALQGLGVSSIEAARKLPADEVLKAKGAFWPAEDHFVMMGDFYDLLSQGRFNDTPVIVGNTSEEGVLFVPSASEDSLNSLLHGFGPFEAAVRAGYPYKSKDEIKPVSRAMFRDATFGWSTWTWGRVQSARPGASPVYAYIFDYADAKYPFFGLHGPMHGAEVSYVFGLVDKPSPEDQRMSELMMSYWINFARTGNPNGKGLPRWPQFDPAGQQQMRLNPDAAPVETPFLDKLKVFDQYFAWLRTR